MAHPSQCGGARRFLASLDAGSGDCRHQAFCDTENVYSPLASQAADAAAIKPPAPGAAAASLNAASDPGELITRTLRREVNRVSSRVRSGLTLLASVGSTAPFVGLFGTLWGYLSRAGGRFQQRHHTNR